MINSFTQLKHLIDAYNNITNITTINNVFQNKLITFVVPVQTFMKGDKKTLKTNQQKKQKKHVFSVVRTKAKGERNRGQILTKPTETRRGKPSSLIILVSAHDFKMRCTLSVTVVVEGNGIGDTSSIPGWGCLHCTWEKHESVSSPPSYGGIGQTRFFCFC